jgi:hypothetical protein
MADYRPFSDDELEKQIAGEVNPVMRLEAIAERERRHSAQRHQELIAEQQRLRASVDLLISGQVDVKRSVDQLSHPHRLLWWTFAVALLTLVVCVIGYWDQILRLLRGLQLWH